MVACFRDDGAAPRMTHQEDRALLHLDDPVDCFHIVAERAKRVLNGDCLQTFLGQVWNDLRPARSIGKCTVDKNDRTDCHVAIPFVVKRG
jgi:hypothetical protein